MSVNELVEQTADFIEKMPHKNKPTRDWCVFTARQILSHPKIVFLEDDQSFDYTSIGYSVTNHEIIQAMLKAGFRKVTSLAEAIKIIEEK